MHGKLSGSQGRPRSRLAGILLLSLTLHLLLLIALKLPLAEPLREDSTPSLELVFRQPATPKPAQSSPPVQDAFPSLPTPAPGDEPETEVAPPDLPALPWSFEPPPATLPDRETLQAQLRAAVRETDSGQPAHRQLGMPADPEPVPQWWNAIDGHIISPAAEPEMLWRDQDGGIGSRRVLSDGRIICGRQPPASVDGSFNWWMDNAVKLRWECGRDRSQVIDFRRDVGPG